MYSCSWWPTRYSPSRTTSALASAASTSVPASIVYWANVWSDSSGSKTPGSFVVRGIARRRASRRVALSGAASRARGSAWCWISPPTGTRIGWSLLIELTMFSPGMSAAVTTTTFDHSKSGSNSSASKVACASVERMVVPYHAPGTTMSSVYRAVPVSLARPSRRNGGAGRAIPGTTVSGGTTMGPAGDVPVVIRVVWEPPWRTTIPPAMPGPPDRDIPPRTILDRPPAVPYRTDNVSRSGHPMVTFACCGPIIGGQSPIFLALITGTRNHGTHAGRPAAGPRGRDRREYRAAVVGRVRRSHGPPRAGDFGHDSIGPAG